MPNPHRLLLLVVLVAAGMLAAAFTAGAKTTASTLTMNATLALRHGAEGPFLTDGVCEKADDCAGRTFRGPFPGLGQVEGRYDFPVDDCGQLSLRAMAYPIRLTVVGKGEIHVAVAEAAACVSDVVSQAQTFIVTGGTGSYAGASGSGTLTRSVGPLGAHGRTGTETWTGTLEVLGFDFDVTPPTLSGATSKTVRAPKGAKRVRVTYKVTATDNADGAVPVSCLPRSGSRFPVGRTVVKCSAMDSSANTGNASFRVTVRRR
jgi:HYR domain